MLLHACGGSRRFQAVLGGSRGLQGASRGFQEAPEASRKRPASGQTWFYAPRRVPPKPRTWARLKFHAGWSGWTRPPSMAGGGGVVGFLKGSERLRLDALANRDPEKHQNFDNHPHVKHDSSTVAPFCTSELLHAEMVQVPIRMMPT